MLEVNHITFSYGRRTVLQELARVPYGEEITLEKLKAIHHAESALRDLGFPQVRVRHHGEVARIEVPPAHRSRFFDEAFMDLVNETVKKAGFKFASLDLGGYVMGNLNRRKE